MRAALEANRMEAEEDEEEEEKVEWGGLLGFAIVMGADWPQGPHHNRNSSPDRAVSVLLVTRFLSAGLAAALVGVWADQHSRRKHYLVFCIPYTLACVSHPSGSSPPPSPPPPLHEAPASFPTIMGRSTLTNGLVATAARVVSNQLDRRVTGSSSLLSLRVWVSLGLDGTWAENGAAVVDRWTPTSSRPVLLVLGLTRPASRAAHTPSSSSECPLCKKAAPSLAFPSAHIFSAFTISTMLGSLIYTTLTALSRGALQDPRRTGVPSGLEYTSACQPVSVEVCL
ncbi:hypothetical protein D9611_012000 [Ephemerocybe angulata]|uniref:Uncharacterized protein n=1 Tax=Ephemerocybe angulata TaxID=980116 RepID=A0A8H5C3P5_9AGAR|nr:hypothetical protein D9611_012000 [Tulosesus angulatus]